MVRRFSVNRIMTEIKQVKEKYNMDFVKFGDDLFALKVDPWLEEFVDRYSAEIGVPFNCYLRLDMVEENLLRLLKKAGCYSVHLSVDSCSQYIREKVLNRKWRDINIEDKINMVHKFGIKTWVNFMLAVPESTLEDDMESISLCRRTGVTHPNFSTTVPIKGTLLYDRCLEKGLINKDYVGDMGRCAYRSSLDCFSEKEKDIRYNIFCLGALAAIAPFPIHQLIMWAIRTVRPNKLFKKIHDWYWLYSINNLIFRIKK